MEYLQNKLQKWTMIDKSLYFISSLLIISAHTYLYQCTHCSVIFNWWELFDKVIDLSFFPFLFNLVLIIHIFLRFIKGVGAFIVWIEYFTTIYIILCILYWFYVLYIFGFSFWQYSIYALVYVIYLVFMYRTKVVYS